jgi:hypothetical protein
VGGDISTSRGKLNSEKTGEGGKEVNGEGGKEGGKEVNSEDIMAEAMSSVRG